MESRRTRGSDGMGSCQCKTGRRVPCNIGPCPVVYMYCVCPGHITAQVRDFLKRFAGYINGFSFYTG